MADRKLTREEWARAALEALEASGPEAIAIVPLARSLGVTRGSFYWHFANRDELLAAALERWYALHVASPLEELRRVADPRRRLEMLLDLAVKKSPTIFAQLLASPEPLVQDAVRRAADARLEFLEAAYVDLGLSQAVARDQALLVYAAYLGLAQLQRARAGTSGPPRQRAVFARHLKAQLIP